MKKAMRFLVPVLLALILSCDLDGWGWLFSSDVDDRFAENQGLAAVTPPVVPAPPFSFIVITDTHVYPGNDTTARFAALQADIAANTDQFVLVCGDLVQSGALADYQEFNALTGGLGVPVYTALGNHDLYNNGWPNYRSTRGRSQYAFTAGPVRFICLDSANGTLGAPQRAWLENELAAKGEPLCITFTHFQFFADQITETQQWTDINEIYSLMHLLETSGVNIHFAGHTHAYLSRTINGTEYCTALGFQGGYTRVTVTATAISYTIVEF